jgi:hypothetical protein
VTVACGCACHVGGAFRPACDVPGGCGPHPGPAAPAARAAPVDPGPGRLRQWAGEDLAELPDLYRKARQLLVRGRESYSERTVGDDQMAEADYQAMLDRHARDWNAVRGWPTPGESPAPPVLYVLQAITGAEQLVAGVAGRLRRHLQLGPLFVTVDPLAGPAHLRCTHPTCRTIRAQDTRPAAYLSAAERFARARDWIARAGLPAADGPLLRQTAADIGRARARLAGVVGSAPTTVKLRVPCPECDRLSLRVLVDLADRTSSYVSCWAEPCAARWPWADWPKLGERIGVDVWDAMRGAAAA